MTPGFPYDHNPLTTTRRSIAQSFSESQEAPVISGGLSSCGSRTRGMPTLDI